MTEQQLNESIERMMIRIHILLAFRISQHLVERHHVDFRVDTAYQEWRRIIGKSPFDDQLFQAVSNLFMEVNNKRND